MLVLFQAKNYIKSLPKVQKKDFGLLLRYANPLGNTFYCAFVFVYKEIIKYHWLKAENGIENVSLKLY